MSMDEHGGATERRPRRAGAWASGARRLCLVTGVLALAGCPSPSSDEPADATGATGAAAGDASAGSVSEGGASGAPAGGDTATSGRVGIDDVPAEARAANNRGAGLMGRYDYAEAVVAFEAALAAAPDWSVARVNRAIAIMNRQRDGDEATALAAVEDVLADVPDDVRAAYVAGLLRFRAGDSERAVALLERVVEADPTDAHANYFYGQAVEPEDRDAALAAYDRAIASDPYLRSAYYRASTVRRRTGDADAADSLLETFLSLEPNPQATTAEFIYSKMGPKAEAWTSSDGGPRGAVTDASPAFPRPDGPVFGAPAPLLAGGGPAFTWAGGDGGGQPVAVDIDGDGRSDLFVPSAFRPSPDAAEGGPSASVVNAILIRRGDTFVPRLDPGLADVPGVHASAWGDLDDDGDLDVFLLRRGAPDILLLAEPGDTWRDVTDVAGVGGGDLDTEDALIVDADHDGDLDIVCARAGAPDELFSNDGDGRFRAIGLSAGIDGGTADTRRVLAGDFDGTRDLDLMFLTAGAAPRVHLNELLWEYVADPIDWPLDGEVPRALPPHGAVAVDHDADGRTDVVGRTPRAEVLWMQRRPAGTWSDTVVSPTTHSRQSPADRGPMAVLDVDGDGRLDVLEWPVSSRRAAPGAGASGAAVGGPATWQSTGPRWRPLDIAASDDAGDWREIVPFAAWEQVAPSAPGGWPRTLARATWTPILLDDARGPAIAVFLPDTAPLIIPPGPGRYDFTTLRFRGRTNVADSLRSNASGIGTRYAARTGDRWSVGRVLPTGTWAGHGLEPVAIGLGGRERLDFVLVEWTDGVFQSEVHGSGDAGAEPISLAAGEAVTIVETQRQLSSCPVLFTWDGEGWRFVSDVLGVGGVGFLLEPGVYAPPRPRERFVLPDDVLAPRGDGYELKLHEPMEEVCYLDRLGLVAWDLPPGWDVAVDERLDAGPPAATGATFAFRHADTARVTTARTGRGQDVTATVQHADGVAVPLPTVDRRFIGRTTEPHRLELAFDRPLAGSGADALADPVLLVDGWVEYPYAQTNFAAWQAGATYDAPTLEAQASDGTWHVVAASFGYPAGMPRRMALPLAELPDGCQALRLTSNLEVYWDRIVVIDRVDPASVPGARGPIVFPLEHAVLDRTGFPARTTHAQRRPDYDYADRRPFWDMRALPGRYTRLGDVTELVNRTDDGVVVYGPGEEVHARFDASDVAAPPDGWTRRFIFESDGWCKDMDLYTGDGQTVGPIPSRAGVPDPDGAAMTEAARTRFRAGR